MSFSSMSSPPDLPPISEQMRAFLDKSFQRFPGRWYAHLERFEADIDAQLVSRGLVEREEHFCPILKRQITRYRAPVPAGMEVADM